jgi:hypothetical protein
LQCLGDALSSFLSGLDVCEDIYSIGKAAHAVASYMESSVDIQSRRKTAMNKCSLLLVDRSLDLATASSHSLDSLSGAIYGLLPRMEGHTTDVSVDMSPVFSRLNKCAPKGSTAVPGQIKNEKLFSSFFLKKQKEAAMSLSRRLLEALTEEGVSVDMKAGRLGKAPAQQLQHLLQHFKEQDWALWQHLGLVQLSCAATQALTHSNVAKWEKLLSLEKLMSLYIREGEVEDAFHQLVFYVNEQSKVLNEVKNEEAIADILCLCCHLYSLLGPDIVIPHTSEEELKEALCELFIQGVMNIPKKLKRFNLRSSISEVDIRAFVCSDVLPVLHGVQMARGSLRQFRNLVKSDVSEPFQPLIVQVMGSIFNPSKPAIGDLVHHSQGLAGKLLHTGISLFMSSAAPRPSSYPLMIVYVIGGITADEIRRINEIASNQSSNCKVRAFVLCLHYFLFISFFFSIGCYWVIFHIEPNGHCVYSVCEPSRQLAKLILPIVPLECELERTICLPRHIVIQWYGSYADVTYIVWQFIMTSCNLLTTTRLHCPLIDIPRSTIDSSAVT